MMIKNSLKQLRSRASNMLFKPNIINDSLLRS